MSAKSAAMIKVYEYKACSTCQKARRFLEANQVPHSILPIVESPPPLAELKAALRSIQSRGGSLKDLFNTSGELYRSLKVADQLKAGLSEAEALKLLSQNGKLIKRPFVISRDTAWVGFKEDQWIELLSLNGARTR